MARTKSKNLSQHTALKFVILIGLCSMFADMTYEGARSSTGPFLAVLGASATVVGFVAGFGELVGYSLRLVSGYVADRTARYWAVTIFGYVLNVLAVPLLALAGSWQMAAVLIILERTGKAIRTPARDAMLSHASHQMGMGWGFGLHEALDQAGAMIGPLIFALVLYLNGSYREGFAILAFPAIAVIIVLLIARWLYPHPQNLEIDAPQFEPQGIASVFWIYVAGSALIAAGYADFSLMAYHFEKTSVLPKIWIPLSYAIAKGTSAVTAPLLGIFYDRKGFVVLIVITVVTAAFAPLVFLGGFWLALIGVALWSVGMGAQESLMRAIVAHMAPSKRRASAYGIFNAMYGFFWFLGSAAMGILYDTSIPALVTFSLVIQLAAVPLLLVVMKKT